MKDILLQQSNAIRTLVLPEVLSVVNSVPVDYDSVIKYTTGIMFWLKPMIDLSDFSVYPTNGITEGLNWWYGRESRSVEINAGDYQWIESKTVGSQEIHYMSVPSAIDGNHVDIPTRVPVALDIAYVGSTAIKKIDIADNVEYVFYSLSKSFGIRNVRTGWIFTRTPDRKLEELVYGAKYYNYHARNVSEKIISSFALDHVYNRLRDQQEDISSKLELQPSDSVWLATTTHDDYQKFRRKDNVARLCLAPLYKT